MKKLIIASLLIAGLATTGMVWAHGNGGNGMMGSGYGMMGHGMMGGGYGMMGHRMTGHGMMGGVGQYNCPMAAGVDNTEYQKFLDDTSGLRKQIHDKRFDYMEAQRNPNTTQEQLGALEKEIYDLQSQLRDKAVQDK